MTERLRLVL